jgi:hypothetical protein
MIPNVLTYAPQSTSIATTRSVPLAFGVPRPLYPGGPATPKRGATFSY